MLHFGEDHAEILKNSKKKQSLGLMQNTLKYIWIGGSEICGALFFKESAPFRLLGTPLIF